VNAWPAYRYTEQQTQCEECQGVIQAAIDSIGNETATELIIQTLITKCHSLNLTPEQEELCDSVSTTLVELFPKINKALESLAWDVPLAMCSTLLNKCNIPCCDAAHPHRPEQVHLALGRSTAEMVVSWVTLADTPVSSVYYGAGAIDSVANGTTSTYTMAGWVGRIHSVVLTGLKPGAKYTYFVGSPQGWSTQFSFTTLPFDPNTNKPTASFSAINFAVIGDMDFGNASDGTVSNLLSLVKKGEVHTIIHMGDISYADGYQKHWDVFMRKVEPIAAHVPYMTIPGNHEFWGNFTSYKSRFFMPGLLQGASGYSNSTCFYSFNVGPIHFIGFNTETEIDTADITQAQLNWLKQDLDKANANRKAQPWIVAYGHRPLYCTNNNKMNCESFAGLLRLKAETLFASAKVDLIMAGHQHDYERTYPLFMSKKIGSSYAQPLAPVYIVNGAAGNREGIRSNFIEPAPEYIAKRLSEAGYGILSLRPNYDLNWKFYANAGNVVRDEITITKKL